MKVIYPKELTQKENYSLLTGAVIPRPVAVVSTQSVDKVVNVAPFSYFNVVSSKPAMVSVSVQRLDGKMKDTARNILATKEAVVHVLDEGFVEEANKTAALLPSNQSELEVANLTTIPSTLIATPGLKEPAVRLETTLAHYLPIEHEGEITADLFLLEVVAYHLAEEILNPEKTCIEASPLRPVSRLAGNNYAKLGEQFTLVRPTK